MKKKEKMKQRNATNSYFSYLYMKPNIADLRDVKLLILYDKII